ncbi:MAG: hypothetical protein ACI8QF_004722, partial [Limisphaerales bacterium]
GTTYPGNKVQKGIFNAEGVAPIIGALGATPLGLFRTGN